MTPFHVTAPTHRLAPTVASRIARAGRRAWHTYWDWRARQATVEILRALDNRTLHDIGLSRSEIESVVRDARNGRRPCYDESWRWRAGA
jgi:uncharacterized protein YjiS (DUF1127 family)